MSYESTGWQCDCPIEVPREHLLALINVATLYLQCLDNDPENELLTTPESIMVTDVREAVDWYDREIVP